MHRTCLRTALAALALALLASLPAAAVARTLPTHVPQGRTSSAPFIRVTPPPGLRAFALGAPILGTNWAGYASVTSVNSPASNSVSDVVGTWVVPTVTAGPTDAYCADWIGIDGFASGSVEQLGTEEDSIGGSPYYAAWWEMYPAGSVQITSMHISPGVTMTAEVRWVSGNTFFLTMTDVTTGFTFSTTRTLTTTAARSSAEWIHEAPSSNSGVLPLAQTTRCVFSSCNATVNGSSGAISSPLWQNAAMWIVSGSNSSLVLADTSALNGAGTGFSVGPPVTSVDTTPPTTTSSAVATYSNSAAITLFPSDNSGGSGVAHTYYTLDGGAQTEGTAINVATYGSHTIVFWSVDNAGNVESPHTAVFFINDTIPPSTTSNAGPTYAGTALITLTASDNAGGSGLAHTYHVLDGGAQTEGTSVSVSGLGPHTLAFWSVDNTGNVEGQHIAAFTVNAGLVSSALTISASPSSVRLPAPFVLSGTLAPAIAGDLMAVYVKKPGSARWSYSSARLTYGALGNLWWYRYTPVLRGTYQFQAKFAGDATRLPSSSAIIAVTVR